ncbi:MAG: AAA family ATPase [Micavibrio sp.]|nr:AAA family ATPase [Micavibrio sp.]
MPVSIFDFIKPSFTDESNAVPEGQFEHTEVDMNAIKNPLSDDLMARLEDTLNRDKKAHDLYYGIIEKPSRSEYDFTLTQLLRWDGYSLQDVAHVLWHYRHGKGSDLTKREIVRCYNRVDPILFPDLGLEYCAKIESQKNPITVARKMALQRAERNSGLITGDKVDYRENSTPLVKGLIDRNTTNLFFGPSTGGKSFAMIDMGISIAKGDDFWDQYRIPEKCGVLIVVGEGGGGYHKRVEVAMRKHDITDRSPQNFPFGFINGTFNMFNDDEFSMQSRKQIVDAVKELERLSGRKVRLVVYDTMSKMLGSGNENDAKDVRVFQANAEKIAAQCDLASLIVHHIGKDEKAGPRGSYALLADMDAQLEITVKKTNNQRIHYIKSTKQKDHRDDLVTQFKLNIMELDKDDDGDPIDSCFIVLKNDQNAALFPSVEDDLDFGAKCALKAIRYYHSIPDIENSSFALTEKQIKTILFNDFKEGKAVFNKNDATNTLSQLSVMPKPDKTITKAFERCCDTLATEGLTRKKIKYQLLDEDCDTYDEDAT